MNIRTFWNILLKIIGIFLVINGVTVSIQSLTVFSALTIASSIFYIVFTLGTLVLYFFVLWLFVFKTSWLIDRLDLENGFEEERIDLKNDFSAILTIAIIVIGGITFLDTLPILCKYLFAYFQDKSMHFKYSPNASWVILFAIKVAVAYLLMKNSRRITAFIYKRSGEKKEDNS